MHHRETDCVAHCLAIVLSRNSSRHQVAPTGQRAESLVIDVASMTLRPSAAFFATCCICRLTRPIGVDYATASKGTLGLALPRTAEAVIKHLTELIVYHLASSEHA